MDEVFEENQAIADQGTVVLRNVFAQADLLWREALRSKTVHQLIQEALGNKKILPINWNHSEERRELLIRKVMRNIYGNDQERVEEDKEE